MINIVTTQLRTQLQLFSRPYSDVFPYDGTPYYDLSRREIVGIFSISGTVAGLPKVFTNNVDYQITAGSIDWTLGKLVPDFGTAFTVQYTYSRLAENTAASACLTAQLIVGQALGPSYPYGMQTTSGINYDDLARMLQVFIACREACKSLVAAEIDLADKYRRGSVLVDDSKKTVDWLSAVKEYDDQYEKYLSLVKPRGKSRFFGSTSSTDAAKVFPSAYNTAISTIGGDGFSSGLGLGNY